jgi:hypothetical protein
MRFTRLIPALAVAALAVACAQDAPTAPDPPQLSVEAASIPKLEFPVNFSFPGFNPCTGLEGIVTITGTIWVQEHPNNRTIRYRGTISTSDGYTGHWVETWTGSNMPGPAGPGDVSNHTMNNMLAHPSGSKYRVHLVWIADFKPEPWTVRVDRFSATCVIP